MKKIFTTALLATIIGNANAMPVTVQANMTRPANNTPYNIGYSHGRHDAYQKTAQTLFLIGTVAIAGIIIYNLGENSRWGFTDDGQVRYRF